MDGAIYASRVIFTFGERYMCTHKRYICFANVFAKSFCLLRIEGGVTQ